MISFTLRFKRKWEAKETFEYANDILFRFRTFGIGLIVPNYFISSVEESSTFLLLFCPFSPSKAVHKPRYSFTLICCDANIIQPTYTCILKQNENRPCAICSHYFKMNIS